MISGTTLAPAHRRPPARRSRRRRWWLVAFALLLVVATGFAVGRGLDSGAPAAAPVRSAVPSAPAPSGATTTGPATSPKPSAATLSPTALQLVGAVPTHGTGVFTYSQRRGRILGTKGTVKHFKVAVERGSNEDVEAYANSVESTLGDARSWIGGGQFRLQLVPGGAAADFTVFLATRDTAFRMCLKGGTGIAVDGKPYTSCRAPGKAIINLDRWRLSARPFLTAKVPLVTYRQYVINHEVGHEFGHHHVGCPKAGGPSPVMVQQTLTVRGCRPYAWPRLGSKFLTGPSL